MMMRGQQQLHQRGGQAPVEESTVMSIQGGQAEMGIVMRSNMGMGKITVNVCGRTIDIAQPCSTQTDVQAQLQDELGMPDQVFEIFDSCGSRLLLDSDIVEAINDMRVPFSATLSDASIHFIENRREELAQMQWKLVRDQHNMASTKLALFGRKLYDLDNRLDAQKQEADQSLMSVRSELLAAVEAAKELSRNEFKMLGERLAGVGQLVQVERNMREVAFEQVNKALQGVRDTIDSDRSLVEQGNETTIGHIDGTRKLLEAERRSREALEEKQQRDQECMLERIQELQNSIQSAMGEYSRHLSRASQDTAEAVESHGRKANRVKNDLDVALESTAARLKVLEERSATLEAYMAETTQRSLDHAERISNRHDKVSTTTEALKFDVSQHGQSMQSIAKKLDELQAAIHANEVQIEQTAQRERFSRDELLQSIREAISADQDRLRSLLESKISHSVQMETRERQDHLSTVLNTIDSVLKNNVPGALSPAPPNQGRISDSVTDLSTPRVSAMNHGSLPHSSTSEVPVQQPTTVRTIIPEAAIAQPQPQPQQVILTASTTRAVSPRNQQRITSVGVPTSALSPTAQAGPPRRVTGAPLPVGGAPPVQYARPPPANVRYTVY